MEPQMSANVSAPAGRVASQREVARRLGISHTALHNPGRSAVWHVLGLECSIREWVARRGWSGRPVPQPIAGGMLVAGLGILAMHFGLVPRERAA